MSQVSFDFGFKAELKSDDFIVSSCNSHAYAFIQSWPEWPFHAGFIYGPQLSGKSHLARIWKQRANAKGLSMEDLYKGTYESCLINKIPMLLEDIEVIHDEVALLHFFNVVKEHAGFVLLTALKHPVNLGIRLPDLRSRLKAINCIGISEPDDALLTMLFTKQFSDRQLYVPQDVVAYLVKHADRSFSGVSQVVEEIDKKALHSGKRVTVPFIKTYIL